MKIYKLLLIVVIGFLGLGTLGACGQQKKTEQKEKITMTKEEKKKLRKEEEKIALYLVNHYQDVKKIEFVNFHKGGFGTGDTITIKVNNSSYILPTELESKDGYYSIGYDPKDFHLIEKKPPTQLTSLDGVDVSYYEDY
jgi:ubiquitin C-terminal hydrolase, putative